MLWRLREAHPQIDILQATIQKIMEERMEEEGGGGGGDWRKNPFYCLRTA